MTNKIYIKSVFTIFVVVFVSSCTVIPVNESARNITVHENKPKVYCKNLGTVSGEYSGFTAEAKASAMNKMINAAAELKANYVQILHVDASQMHNQYTGQAFQCDDDSGSVEIELKDGCIKNDPDLCFEYATKLATDNKQNEANIALDKACKLGNQEACDTQKKYGRDLETQKKFSELSKKCSTGNGKSCLAFSFLANRYGYADDAIFLAQKACLHNVQEGCNFYSKLMDEKQIRENAYRQEQVQNQNQQIQQEQLRLQRAAMIEQMRQQSNQNMINSLQGLSNTWSSPRPQPTQQTNCTTRSRKNWYGNIEYYTDCESN